VLFTVTFTAGTTGKNLALNLDETSDVFGMEGHGSSTNIYAAALLDSTLDIIALPTIDIVPVVAQPGPYAAGEPIEFNITVNNPADGGTFADLNLDFTLPTGAVLQYCSTMDNPCTTWTDVTDPMDIGTLAAPASAIVGPLPLFRVIFPEAGTGTITVGLVDLSPVSPVDSFTLATASEEFTLAGGFTVTGTFSMQGRATREGIPVNLRYQVLTGFYADKPGETINQISYNLTITGVNGGSWLLTTNQPRYLNVIAANKKLVAVNGDETLLALELKGGDATLDNAVGLGDASVVGGMYGTGTIANDADVNYDNKVNVQDLALVGGNYGLTSETAYGITNAFIWLVQ